MTTGEKLLLIYILLLNEQNCMKLTSPCLFTWAMVGRPARQANLPVDDGTLFPHLNFRIELKISEIIPSFAAAILGNNMIAIQCFKVHMT